MMQNAISRYEDAVSLLPEYLRQEAKLPRRMYAHAEEIRLRAGRKVSVLLAEGELVIGEKTITAEDLNAVLEVATGASAYSVRDSVKAGYVTAKGGYRIGLCGSAVVKNGEADGFRELSSLAIRIPREVTGISRNVIGELIKDGQFSSTLIISPPGGGKTTFLRDMVRILSDGDSEAGFRGKRVSLADERGEIACLYKGIPGRNVGIHTDVLDGCPKAQAVMILLRAMNPQIIAIDEITAPEDISVISQAANCGVSLIATAHAESLDDLKRRCLYRQILDSGVFENAVLIEKTGSRRKYTAIKLKGGDA